MPDEQNQIIRSCEVKIEALNETVNSRFDQVQTSFEQELNKQRELFIEELKEKTNPLILSFPTIALICMIGLIFLILKGVGKI